MTHFAPIPDHAAAAHLSARPLTPILDTLPPQDIEVLRCAGLNARLLVNILGSSQPTDMLRSTEGHIRAITAALPCRGVLLTSTTLWVHVSGPLPDSLEVNLPRDRRSRLPCLVTKRGRLSHYDTTVIGGITCATIARVVADTARLGTPVQAVQAILTARNHGVSQVCPLLTLSHCHGTASRGCPRVRHIIESVALRQ